MVSWPGRRRCERIPFRQVSRALCTEAHRADPNRETSFADDCLLVHCPIQSPSHRNWNDRLLEYRCDVHRAVLPCVVLRRCHPLQSSTWSFDTILFPLTLRAWNYDRVTAIFAPRTPRKRGRHTGFPIHTRNRCVGYLRLFLGLDDRPRAHGSAGPLHAAAASVQLHSCHRRPFARGADRHDRRRHTLSVCLRRELRSGCRASQPYLTPDKQRAGTSSKLRHHCLASPRTLSLH